MGKFRRELRGCTTPLTVEELRRQGVSGHMLAGPRWLRTHHGLYRPAETAPPTTGQRIVDVAAAVPEGGAVAGWAAAYVQGADRLDGLDDHTMQPLPVPVLLPVGLHRAKAPGVRYKQPRRASDFRVIAGVPVTSPVDTAVDVARWSPNLCEAVVAVDAVLDARLCAPHALLAGPVIGPGSRQVNRAMELSRRHVLSNWESRLRMFWVLDLRLPSPLVNSPVFDLDGTFLGAPDLLDADAGLAMEYDGARWQSSNALGHRDADQHRKDNHREEAFERTSLIVVRVDKIDLTRERRRLATRLQRARADGLSRDRTRDRWTLQEPPGWVGMPA